MLRVQVSNVAAFHFGYEDGFIAIDDDGMFVLSRDAAIGGAEGPAVVFGFDAGATGIEEGLEGDDHAILQDISVTFVVVVGDGGFFVDMTPDAVASELAQGAVAVALGEFLDRAADGIRALTGAGQVDCQL